MILAKKPRSYKTGSYPKGSEMIKHDLIQKGREAIKHDHSQKAEKRKT